MKLIISILIVFTGISAFAEQDTETCFRERSIRSWRALNPNTLEVRGTRNTKFRVDVWSCFELQWSNRIAFETNGFSRVCRGDNILVLDDFSNKIKDRCRIRGIRRVQ